MERKNGSGNPSSSFSSSSGSRGRGNEPIWDENSAWRHDLKDPVVDKGKFNRSWIMHALNKSKAGKGFEAGIKRKVIEFTHVRLDPNKDDMYIWDIAVDDMCILLPSVNFCSICDYSAYRGGDSKLRKRMEYHYEKEHRIDYKKEGFIAHIRCYEVIFI
jgi:hypothetical protein